MPAVRPHGRALRRRATPVLSGAAVAFRVRPRRTRLGRVGSGLGHLGSHPVTNRLHVRRGTTRPPVLRPRVPLRGRSSRSPGPDRQPAAGADPRAEPAPAARACTPRGVTCAADGCAPVVCGRRASSAGASISATAQGAPGPARTAVASTPSRVQNPPRRASPPGAANWCSRRPAGRHSPTQLPARPVDPQRHRAALRHQHLAGLHGEGRQRRVRRAQALGEAHRAGSCRARPSRAGRGRGRPTGPAAARCRRRPAAAGRCSPARSGAAGSPRRRRPGRRRPP